MKLNNSFPKSVLTKIFFIKVRFAIRMFVELEKYRRELLV